jgi:hypothetical protein
MDKAAEAEVKQAKPAPEEKPDRVIERRADARNPGGVRVEVFHAPREL